MLAKQMAEYLVAMQYGMAATLLKGLEDFLSGPSVLADGGVEAAAAIRKLRADYPDTHRKQPADLPVDAASTVQIYDDPGIPPMLKAVLVKRVLNILAGRTGGAAQMMAGDAKWWNVSRFKSVIVTDSAQDAFRCAALTVRLSSISPSAGRNCWPGWPRRARWSVRSGVGRWAS
ncbi:hypothetical protein [Kibdelosporangium philippinense]|uniref:hypothetical protein n=1 Tax=Kibdelosporangium philippinense TaxID=211113 RepID=UPI00361127E0